MRPPAAYQTCMRLMVKLYGQWKRGNLKPQQGKKRVAPAGNWKEMPKMHIQTECQAKLNNNYKVQANWESQQQRWPIENKNSNNNMKNNIKRSTKAADNKVDNK